MRADFLTQINYINKLKKVHTNALLKILSEAKDDIDSDPRAIVLIEEELSKRVIK